MTANPIGSFVNGLLPGPVALVGGHYDWPGRPGLSARCSAAEIARLAREDDTGRLFAYTFLNDIGFSCIPGLGCSLPGQRPATDLEVEGLAPWAAEHLPELERSLAAGDGTWPAHARSLSRLLAEADGGAAAWPFVERLRHPEPDSLETWLEDLELLLYSVDKDLFRPLVLGLKAACTVPEVLFERSMNNGASRMLHKIRKKNGLDTGLKVTFPNGGGESVWTVAGGGQEIELRREQCHGDGIQAANKCPALLSQLFFYLCRKLSRLAPESRELGVFYIVPCYDRGRLLSGMQAFMELYRDVERWFGARRVTLASAFYTDVGSGTMMCDGLVRAAGEDPVPFLQSLTTGERSEP